MSFNIERGLFKFDFADHHAILGIPLDATPNDIRKRYLKISRRLHPDSCVAESEAVKQQASQLFAKLVNPAYEQLYADQSRAEHNALLGRVGKRLIQEKDKVQIQSELAKKLSKAGNVEQEYKTALQSLIEKQYESIDQVLEQTAQISELNLVYLLRKANQGAPRPQEAAAKPPVAQAAAATAGATKAGTAAAVQKKPEKVETSPTDPYCRRAEEYLEKNYPAKAILEMKDALKMEPKNSRCHGIIAMAYYKSNQSTMAKIHLKNALQFNPQEPIALEVQKLFDKEAERSAAVAKKKEQAAKASSSGGLFGLFGKKPDKNEKKK